MTSVEVNARDDIEGPVLWGRSRELAELIELRRRAFDGRSQLALLVGEPGIGKTALAEAFALDAMRAGATVAWGRAWEAGGAPPYWPWTEALRSLGAETPDEVLAEVGGERWSTLEDVVPEVAARWTTGAPAPRLDSPAARFRLFDAVASVLRRVAAHRPVVIVLDDLHAADLGSLLLLHFVSRALRRDAVMICGTHRDAESRLSAEVHDALTRIAREGRWMKLDRLAPGELGEWIGSLGLDGDATSLERLFHTTEGNPLFVVETLRLLRTKRHGGSGLEISDTVHEVIRRRLEALDERTGRLLESAAVFGRRFVAHHAIEVAGLDALEASDSLVEATRADVIEPVDDERFAFTHILLREVLYGRLTASERSDRHQRAARLFEPATVDDVVDVPSEYIHHLFAAHPRVSTVEAIGWARRSAAAAQRRLAFDTAIGQLEAALRLFERDPGDDRLACDLLLELAAAHDGAGQSNAVHERSRRAAALARKLADPVRLGHAALAFGSVYAIAVVDGELVDLLEEALATLPAGHDALRARLQARLSSALQPARDPEHPMKLAREAIDRVATVTDPQARLEVLVAAGSSLAYFAEPGERVRLDQEIIRVAEAVGDAGRGLRGRFRLAYDLLEAGDAPAADACIEDYERHARQLGLPTFLWMVPVLRGMRAIMAGRFADAAEEAERAATIASEIEDKNARATITLQRLAHLSAAELREHFAAACQPAISLVSAHADPWYAHAFASGMLARSGQFDAARVHLREIAEDVDAMTGRLSMVWAAEASVAVGDRELGRALLQRLPALADRVHCWSMLAMVAERPVTHALGLLAFQQGQLTRAIDWLDDAARRCEALGAPVHRARVEVDLVEVLMARDDRSDRARIEALLDRARRTADALPLPELAARAESLARGGGAVPPGTPTRSPAVLPTITGLSMLKHGEVWTIRSTHEFQLKDSRGLQILARLVAEPGREFHVVDLMAPSGEGMPVSDAGDVLDAAAMAAYRRRLEVLREDEHEAEAFGDMARLERARSEIDALATELARAMGLGGRSRKAASTAEKARINVRQRLKHAMARIDEHDPTLGRHLRWAVRTGTFCVYDPDR